MPFYLLTMVMGLLLRCLLPAMSREVSRRRLPDASASRAQARRAPILKFQYKEFAAWGAAPATAPASVLPPFPLVGEEDEPCSADMPARWPAKSYWNLRSTHCEGLRSVN